MPEVLDDKSEHCIPFILERLKEKHSADQLSPLFVSINGAQGSGKSTLVRGTVHLDLHISLSVASESSVGNLSFIYSSDNAVAEGRELRMMLLGLVWSGEWRVLGFIWSGSNAILGARELRMAFLMLLRSVGGVVPSFNWSSNSVILGRGCHE